MLAKQHNTQPLHVRTRRSDLTLDNTEGEYRIGRDPSADIPLDDSRVSWSHAVLRVDNGVWVLEDRGSTNGTWVGPERASRVEITSVCVVRLGDSAEGPLIRLEPAQAPAQQASAPEAPRPQPYQPPQPQGYQPQPGAAYQPQAYQPQAYQPQGYRPQGYQQGGGYQPPQGGAFTPSHGGPPVAGESYQPGMSLPSVDVRPTGRYQVQAQGIKIGRLPSNEVVVDDLGVSRVHAELRRTPAGRYEIVDLGSHNGTFVNGARVNRKELTEQDLVSIGHSTFRLAGGELREFVDEGSISFTAQDLKVQLPSGRVLLEVSFPIPEKCLMAVIGPSGAGKSTLLGALTGMRPADTGTVLYDNRDLYKYYAELRHRIGLVPQKDIVHLQLTGRAALDYAAALRFPSDTAKNERDNRVREVIEELGLTRHADTRADSLSGGQLKRVSVAMELLTRPSLLFLDEPTSGLDPGLDKQVMEKMQELAHDGRTVIVVTHSTENLYTCDRLLVLVPGGKIAYYGPPDEGLAYFGKSRWPEVFEDFNNQPERDWSSEYKASPYFQKYVASQMTRQQPGGYAGPGAQGIASIGGGESPSPPPPRRGQVSQMITLSRRYAKVLSSDRGFLAVSAILPIVLGGLIAGMPDSFGLRGDPTAGGTNASAITKLLVLVVCACLAGAANSVRELVRERPIFQRERAAGQSSGAYLASKVLVLGVISVVQSIILFAIGMAPSFGKLPPSGSLIHGVPLAELLIAMIVLSVTSMCLGLVISALVPTNEIAMPILVGITMVQVVLSGGIFTVANTVGLAEVSWLAPSSWGMSALASTSDLNRINPHAAGAQPVSYWNHTSGAWLMDIGALIILSVVFAGIAWWRLGKLGPKRRR